MINNTPLSDEAIDLEHNEYPEIAPELLREHNLAVAQAAQAAGLRHVIISTLLIVPNHPRMTLESPSNDSV